ncbi:unnamed protein product [Chilo suppressalis]|uniref:Uncharacterized protein n=1 Tax=Chilo suppressalis TaxID=168631 RepID=A0ABN8BGM1_CHISP|nr:unnamed protein product [Chilo suppressalis]
MSLDFQKYMAELVFGRGSCSKTYCLPCGRDVPCDLPWREIIDKIHKKCLELISDCRFNGAEFPCCERFQPVDSEHGHCYTFNTLQSANPEQDRLYTVNLTTGPGLLSFRAIEDVNVAVHSPEEMFTELLDPKYTFNVRPAPQRRVNFLFSVVEMENDPELLKEDIATRGCRYLDEVPAELLHTYKVYAYDACRLAGETDLSFEHCRCIHPVRHQSYEKFYCNFTGLNCLTNFKAMNTDLKHKHEDDEDCLPSCAESELTRIHLSEGWVYNDTTAGALVSIRMVSLPTLRYKRNLVRNNLDFVVSVGGIVGLFFGASLLSIVEIFYLICRPQNKEQLSTKN